MISDGQIQIIIRFGTANRIDIPIKRLKRGAAVLPIFKTSAKNGIISTWNNFSTKIFGRCIGNDLKIMRT
jgi:hypothetical protein